jgi:hypothetical protein
VEHDAPGWLNTYVRVRLLFITAASCLLVQIVVGALTIWPNALVPNIGYANQALIKGDIPSWWLPTLRFMNDYYLEALLVMLLGAGISLWRNGRIRTALTLLLGMSILWWIAMLGLRIISMTPLGWQGAS